MESFYELAKRRYSERRFSDRPVEQEKLDRILDAGRLGPTAGNTQPQRFFLLRTPEALGRATEAMSTPMFGAPAAVLVCYDARRAWRNQFEKALPNYTSAEQDCAIAAATMMYAAEELGVHTIWMRGFDSGQMREAFGLPEDMVPALVLGLGYPSEESKPAGMHFKRLPIEEYVTELCPEGGNAGGYEPETFRDAVRAGHAGQYLTRAVAERAMGAARKKR